MVIIFQLFNINKEELPKYPEFKYIDDVEFIYCCSNNFTAWKDGKFYTLKELYNRNEISKEELHKISKALHDFELSKYEEKVLCNITLEDEFRTDEILVCIDKSLSAAYKTFEAEFFCNEGIIEIKDLSPTPNEYTLDSYRNIVVLKFNECSKQTIIDYIKKMEKIPGLKIVEPSWILEFE